MTRKATRVHESICLLNYFLYNLINFSEKQKFDAELKLKIICKDKVLFKNKRGKIK